MVAFTVAITLRYYNRLAGLIPATVVWVVLVGFYCVVRAAAGGHAAGAAVGTGGAAASRVAHGQEAVRLIAPRHCQATAVIPLRGVR